MTIYLICGRDRLVEAWDDFNSAEHRAAELTDLSSGSDRFYLLEIEVKEKAKEQQ